MFLFFRARSDAVASACQPHSSGIALNIPLYRLAPILHGSRRLARRDGSTTNHPPTSMPPHPTFPRIRPYRPTFAEKHHARPHHRPHFRVNHNMIRTLARHSASQPFQLCFIVLEAALILSPTHPLTRSRCHMSSTLLQPRIPANAL